jgi:ribonuclease P protein component
MSRSRLRESSVISEVLAGRCRAHGGAVVVHARPRPDGGQGRWAVVAGRKVGSAVARNRAKRRLRALLGAAPPPPGIDVVVVARAAAVGIPAAGLEADLRRALDRAVAACGVAVR